MVHLEMQKGLGFASAGRTSHDSPVSGSSVFDPLECDARIGSINRIRQTLCASHATSDDASQIIQIKIEEKMETKIINLLIARECI